MVTKAPTGRLFAEQLGALGPFGAAAQAAQKLLREVKAIVPTHGHFLILEAGELLRPTIRRYCEISTVPSIRATVLT